MTYSGVPQHSHEDHGALHDVATGVAVGVVLGGLLRNERRPILRLLSVGAALASPLVMALAIAPLELELPVPVVIGLLILAFVYCIALPDIMQGWVESRAVARSEARQRAYQAQVRQELSAVASADEIARLDRGWSLTERSYEDHRLEAELVQRWNQTYPPQYPSQTANRRAGALCRCDAQQGHACRVREHVLRPTSHSGLDGWIVRMNRRWHVARWTGLLLVAVLGASIAVQLSSN